MARNRKRAKERRARRPQAVSSRAREQSEPLGAPNPIEHAAPDAEIAEAAELPPDLTESELEELQLEADDGDFDAEPEPDDEDFDAEEPLEPEPEGAGGGGGRGGQPVDGDFEADGSGGELEAAAHAPARRAPSGNRLLTFLQGSWRELQRVQWPDRRQTMQATGVVIGFVIVAGVFLGVSDYVAGKVVSLIVNGHF